MSNNKIKQEALLEFNTSSYSFRVVEWNDFLLFVWNLDKLRDSFDFRSNLPEFAKCYCYLVSLKTDGIYATRDVLFDRDFGNFVTNIKSSKKVYDALNSNKLDIQLSDARVVSDISRLRHIVDAFFKVRKYAHTDLLLVLNEFETQKERKERKSLTLTLDYSEESVCAVPFWGFVSVSGIVCCTLLYTLLRLI